MALTPGQQRCIQTLDRSLVVAAGAGSGKTFTLTKRIVGALQNGQVDGIDRICAITFTNKAAGELKSRIKAELRACGMAEQALKVDEAWVSTIHGMCARILRAHAVELDVDPAFGVADGALANMLRDRAIDDTLLQAQVGFAEDVEQAGGALCQERVDALFTEYPARSRGPRGVSVEEMLRTLMDAAGGNVRGYEAFSYAKADANPARLMSAALDAFEDLASVTQGQKPNEARQTWVENVTNIAADVRSELQQGHASDARWALLALDRLPLPKKTGTADYKEHVARALEVYRMCVMELRLAVAVPHLQTLIALAREASRRYAAAKRIAGVLDNSDLLVMASAAIANYPSIAALYADKFQIVMVDEFQDTDQMQVDMIKRLSGPGACRLCTVGDAQQSIYRFRGADVSVYRRHLAEVEADDPANVIKLPDNFRSHADVLSFVDRVFERPQMFGGEFMSLRPGRDESRVKRPFADGEPRVRVQLTSNPSKGVLADRVREVAAARIAETFAQLHERGHSAGEMAVLLGGMTHVQEYADALRARGLACVVSGGSVFASSLEAQVMLDLTRVIANPYQTQALLGVLTSPLFGLCAQDLLDLTTVQSDDGRPRRRNLAAGFATCAYALREGRIDAAWSERLVLALRVLGDALDKAGREPVHCIAQDVAVDSGWIARLQEQGAEGLAQVANAYKAIRMIKGIEESSAAGQARVAADFEALLADSKEAPGALSATGGDFVRIMTVHASKGLEFPIVAVAEFRDAGGDSSKLLTSEVKGTVYVSLDLNNTLNGLEGSAKLSGLPELYASMTEGNADEDELALAVEHADGALALRAALYEYDRVGEDEESKRLLYVALTRAKEALVVSLKGKRTKDNPRAVPKNCLGAVVPALMGSDDGFDVGVSHYDYRGSAPALVEHVALEAEGAGEDSGRADGENGDGLSAMSGKDAPVSGLGNQPDAFPIPVDEHVVPAACAPCTPAHEGVFSYSSIAEASHEGDVLELLAQRHFESADAGQQEAESSIWLQPAQDGEGGLDFSPDWFAASLSEGDGDDGSWAYAGSSSADQDKATDLGTAFHRLAQYAVNTRSSAGLVRPDDDRVRSLSRSCSLDEVQVGRLQSALDRWFASDVASFMGALPDLHAEVPFFVRVPADCEAYLEGEIDLLGFDESRTCAYVVDYKTGGKAYETEEDLRVKHVLQASCYAYAIMLQGVPTVETAFVRVERSSSNAPDQPQCVRYRFTHEDVPDLASRIASVYARAR